MNAPWAILEPLLKAGGITALVIGVFYLLYRQLLALRIFQQIGQVQTFVFITLVALLTWSVVIFWVLFGKGGPNAFNIGNGNSTYQNSQVK